MEFLLINHPLDCPICDQGGECDLQDQAMAYGYDDSRMRENKHSVYDKNLGPLIDTAMTRCIHCSRCVRFSAEVAGVPELGMLNRGEDSEITTYLEAAVSSELSGNLVDLCPVGALTSKPYAFTARSWELNKTESIDAMDALGSNIRVDTRGREVMRVMPRLHEDINEEWISDKSRFIWDGLRTQRLDRPYVRQRGKLKEASWEQAFAAIAKKMKSCAPKEMAAIAGDLVSVEDMFALKSLMDSFGVKNIDCRQDGSKLGDAGGRASYLFNSTIAGIEDADAILIIGSNPRAEASVLNARIRKTWLAKDLPIGVIGDVGDLTYDYEHLGNGPDSLKALKAGKVKFLSKLKKAKKPLIIIGQGAVARSDGEAILALAAALAKDVGAVGKDWNGFSVLHTAASRVGGLDLGFVPAKGGKATEDILKGAKRGSVKLVYLLGADEIDTSKLEDAFVIYQGTHGDKGAHVADVILPGSAYTEKSGTYVNTEGRVQMGARAGFPPGDAREDWAIIRALSAAVKQKLPFDNLGELRRAMYIAVPHLEDIDEVIMSDPAHLLKIAKSSGKLEKAAFESAVENFYMSNPIARASEIMAQCSAVAAGAELKGTGTDG